MDKADLRREILARRGALPDRDARSTLILNRVRLHPAFGTAHTLASYVGVGAEVATVPLLVEALERKLKVAVPARDGDRLRLVEISSLSELVPASFGLLEPPHDLAARADRVVRPGSVDVMLVPGVAFDRRGGRLGHGRGYYDRLLEEAGAGPLRVGLAFSCQLVEEVPMVSGDERMDLIVTEEASYTVSARTASEGR